MTEQAPRPMGNHWLPITTAHSRAKDIIVAAASLRDGRPDNLSDRGRQFDIVADGGCGKTVLLGEVATSLRELGYTVLFTTPPERGDPPISPEDRLRREVATCEALIKNLANDVAGALPLPGAGEITERMRKASTAGPAPTTQIGTIIASTTIVNSPGAAIENASNVTITADEPTRLANRLIAMCRALVDELTQLAAIRPVALLVDDCQRLGASPDDPGLPAGTGADQWLRDVVAHVGSILVVRGTRLSPDPTRLADDTTVLHLGPMRDGETRHYVREQLAAWTPSLAEEIGGLIHTGTGGYPVWVATYCQMIINRVRADTSPAAVGQLLAGGLDALSVENVLPRFRNFVDDTAANIVHSRIPLFDQLSVLRRITGPDDQMNPRMITALFDIGHDEAKALYAWLVDCAFMTGFDDDQDAGRRMHDRIREAAESMFGRTVDYRRLHEKAERYYRGILHFDDVPDEKSMWSTWNRYENPVWQRDSREWLHHAGYVHDETFDSTVKAFVRLFLEVFWWWDTLVPTDYSRDLLADYRALLDIRTVLGCGAAGVDGVWLRRLEDFQANYVSGWGQVPGEQADEWRMVDTALRGLWNQYGLGTKPPPDTDLNLRRIKILLCCFRGDAARYRDARFATDAAERYQAAAEACISEDEAWIANWAVYFRADLLVDIDLDKATELAAGLPERIDDVADHELRTHVARLLGDIAWQRGDLSQAFDCYARAVLHAYAYQVRQELNQQAPSEYTATIYQEMRTRTERRLAEAAANGRLDTVEAATSRMLAFFSPYWEEMGADPDNPGGLPSGPQPADLKELGTEYSDMVEWAIEMMADQLNEPLDSPLVTDADNR